MIRLFLTNLIWRWREAQIERSGLTYAERRKLAWKTDKNIYRAWTARADS